MREKIIPIGNSRGIRIPRAVIEQCRFEAFVELDVQDGMLIVRRAEEARAGWQETFREMAERGDDTLLDAKSLPSTNWDNSEWKW
jgi:antitoxin MazE